MVVGGATVVVVDGGSGGSVVTGVVAEVVLEELGAAASDAVHALAMTATAAMSMRGCRDIAGNRTASFGRFTSSPKSDVRAVTELSASASGRISDLWLRNSMPLSVV